MRNGNAMAKDKKSKLPDEIFVARTDEGNGYHYYSADENALDLVDDDEATLIGTYRLVATRRLVKTVVVAEEDGR